MSETPSSPPRLHCLGGEPAPADLAAHLLRLRELPEGARRELWRALDPCLGETIDKEAERALDAFSARHGLTVDELGSVIKACRFLVRSAAQRDTSKAELGQDLDALTNGHALTKEILVSGLDAAKSRLRQEIVKKTISDHHRLVVGVDWELEQVVASSRGEKLGLGLAALTFRYREGEEEKRITLHLLPDGVRAVAAACQRLVR